MYLVVLGFEWPDDNSDANNFQNQPRPPIAKRQHFQQLSTADIQELSAVKQPKNTEYSTKWALKNFNKWKTERNSSFPDNPVNFETLAIRLLSYASISSCDVLCIVCRLLWNFGTNWSRQKHVCLFLYETCPPWGTVWDFCPPWGTVWEFGPHNRALYGIYTCLYMVLLLWRRSRNMHTNVGKAVCIQNVGSGRYNYSPRNEAYNLLVDSIISCGWLLSIPSSVI